MRKIMHAAFLMALGFTAAVAGTHDRLFLDFPDSAHLGAQPPPLPTGQVLGNAHASLEHPGSVDLADDGGILVPGFRQPTGAFSVESRYLLRDYSSEAYLISDILNTATWDNGPTQGFSFRIGGGLFYMGLPRSAFASDSAYQASQGWGGENPAVMSRCIGEFTTAMKGDDRNWKEVVTERCIELNKWVHMVGVWDGENLHIYLNGQEATDPLRVLNPEAVPNMDESAVANVGARFAGSAGGDSRHFDGELDFVRVVDYAMDAMEVKRHFAETSGGTQDTVCSGTIVPVYPHPGQCVKGDSEFRFRLEANGACTNPDYRPKLMPGDAVEIEFAQDPEFKHILFTLTVTDTSFHLDGKSLAEADKYKGGTYWRARIVHAPGSGLWKVAAAPSAWSLSRPIVLDLSSTSLATPRRAASRTRLVAASGSMLFIPARGEARPALWSPAGRRLAVPLEKTVEGWRATLPRNDEPSLFILAWE